MISKLFAAMLAVAAIATTAMAEPAVKNIQIVDCRQHDEAQEKKDRALNDKAVALVKSKDIKGVERLLPDLEAALARAPDVPSLPERCGNTIHVYSDELIDLLEMSALITASPEMKDVSVVQKPKPPYADIAFTVGWIYAEKKDPGAAYRALTKGRLNDPDNFTLLGESIYALTQLHRSREAEELITAYLAAHPDLTDVRRAALLAKRGYARIELGREAEAEADLREALRLDPENKLAKNELKYLADQKKTSQPAT